jgi:hypothetical protein
VRRHFPSLTGVRARSAERRWQHWAPLRRRPRALRGTHASRRSTGGVSRLGTALPGAGQTSLTSPRSRRHWRRPSVRPRPAIEGSSHLAMGTGGGPRRPGCCLRKHSDQAPHPAPPTRRHRKAPSTEQGVPSVQGLRKGTRETRIAVFARWGWRLKAQWIQDRLVPQWTAD